MTIFSRNSINKKICNETVKKLQDRNYVEEGFLDPPRESHLKIGKKKDLFLNLQNLEMII